MHAITRINELWPYLWLYQPSTILFIPHASILSSFLLFVPSRDPESNATTTSRILPSDREMCESFEKRGSPDRVLLRFFSRARFNEALKPEQATIERRIPAGWKSDRKREKLEKEKKGEVTEPERRALLIPLLCERF